MEHHDVCRKVLVLCTFVAAASAASAHGQGIGVGGSASGSADIEQGDVDTGGTASGSGSEPPASAPTYASSEPAADPGYEGSSGGSSDVRLGVQARWHALNVVGAQDRIVVGGGGTPGRLVDPIDLGIGPTVPLVTPGVRLAENRLFLGLGLGLVGGSNDTGGTSDRGQSGFSLSPLVSYDLLMDAVAALHLVGWFNLANLGEEEDCAGNTCADDPNSDASGLGLNVGAGIRGKLNEGIAIGGEFGWGFMSGSVGALDYFNHGLWGALLFEASIGL